MKWAKEEAAKETQNYKNENEDVKLPFSTTRYINKDENRSFNCGYLFLKLLLYKLRNYNTFRNIKSRHDYNFDLSNIFSDLIYSRILHPSSKRETFKYSNTLLEQPIYDDHQIYRASLFYLKNLIIFNQNYIKTLNLFITDTPKSYTMIALIITLKLSKLIA